MTGKRKERDERNDLSLHEPDVQITKGSTLFVSNLPYTATSVDLQTVFSDIAPVRSAFVVLDKETRKSKGVGYVSFAIKEDAALAVEQIEKDGLLLDKRNLRVQFADTKPHQDMADDPMEPKPKRPRLPPHPKQTTPADPLAIRTVVISGLPSSIDSHSLWKKVRKLDSAEKISQWPGKTAAGEDDPTTAQVLFASPAKAQDAVTRLHAHVFKGSLLSAVLKKRMDSLAKSSGKPSRGNRLIIRNLPWNTTEQDLRRIFLPYGPIYSITIPVKKPEEEGGRPLAKGFAFVWMVSKKDAEKAIEGANGTTVGAEKGKEKADPDAKSKERVIAVDWALSKERWEEEKEKLVEEDAVEGNDAASASGSSSEEDSEDEHVGVHEGSDDSNDDEDDDEEPAERPQLPPPETGNTLFIRNVPFTATEDELRTLFRTFGPLRYARITMDAETGRSRGTGFVCFWNKEDADKAIQQAELLNAETGGMQTPAITKKNPFKLTSILTPDPSFSLAQSLVMHGRTLDVTRAVTREEAGKLRELGEKQREKQDKRNMYLMREGVIFPNTLAASTLTDAELEKRVQAFNTRRTLMRSNPSLYVSKTRLSVRQLPLFATERTLKRLALHAVRAFEEEVKDGAREALSADELREDQKEEDANEMAEVNADDGTPSKKQEQKQKQKQQRKRGERQTAVRQAKIVRIAERVDPLSGKGRSKGYGFLEMISHADALRVLRWANNHPGVEGLMKGWWREELGDIVKREEDQKKKNRTDEEEVRFKRLKERVKELEIELERGKEGKGKKEGRTLVLEFSIENIQVVRRRADREEHDGERGGRPSRSREGKPSRAWEGKSSPAKKRGAPVDEKERNTRPTKKTRTVISTAKEVESRDDATAGEKKLKSLIGRKRKEKKLKGKKK